MMKRITIATVVTMVLLAGCQKRTAPPEDSTAGAPKPTSEIAAPHSTPAEADQPANGSAAEAVRLQEARSSTGTKMAQVLSPDGGALAILFDDLIATAQAAGPYASNLSVAIDVPVTGASGPIDIAVDIRGSWATKNAGCVLLAVIAGQEQHLSQTGDSSYAAGARVTIRGSGVVPVAVMGSCSVVGRSDDASGLLTVDSIDVTAVASIQAGT